MMQTTKKSDLERALQRMMQATKSNDLKNAFAKMIDVTHSFDKQLEERQKESEKNIADAFRKMIRLSRTLEVENEEQLAREEAEKEAEAKRHALFRPRSRSSAKGTGTKYRRRLPKNDAAVAFFGD